jgi:IMP dehydrogenase
MKKYLTYDDVNIVPKYSEVNSRGDVKLHTRFTKNTELTIPIVASPMDTVTELDMAVEMMERGGVGILHRFNTIEEQSKMMKSLHRKWDDFFKIGDGRERSADNDYDDWYKKLNGRRPTESDYEDLKDYGIFTDDMAKDDRMWRRKPLCAAVGATGDYLERAEELVKNGCNVILIDVAHGHHSNVGEAIEKIKSKISNVEVIAGNIATGDGARFLCRKGADGIRVGIGNGSLCETRIRTGVGLPQVSVLLDVCSVADEYNVPIIADGGIRNVGDVAKGIGCGADSIMVGSLLSGTKESPGSIEKQGQWPNEKLFKKYRGSASRDSKGNDKNVEGNHKVIPYKGKVNRILSDITDGLRSSCSYVGAIDIDEYHSKVEFVEVTNAGQVEARPHLLN